MDFIKIAGVVAIIGAAAAIVIKNDLDQKAKDKELDEFLMPDETEEVVEQSVENSFENDILSIKNTPATILFTLNDKDKCLLFQDLLSEKGLSSNFMSDGLKVEVSYHYEITEENLNELLKDLKDVLEKVEAKYEGCR